MRDSSNKWFPITDKSIENIQDIDSFSSKELNQKVTEKCKEILSDLKNDEVGTEETVSIRISSLESEKQKGEQGTGGVKFIEMDSPYVAIHNHPSNETFSIRDLEVLWSERLCQSIVVVGNKGNIFVMNKNNSYDALGFFQHIMSEKLGLTKHKSRKDFMKEAEKYGLEYYEKTN